MPTLNVVVVLAMWSKRVFPFSSCCAGKGREEGKESVGNMLRSWCIAWGFSTKERDDPEIAEGESPLSS